MSIMFAAGVDWSVPTFVLLAGLVLRALAGAPAAVTVPEPPGAPASAAYGRVVSPVLIAVAFAHAFAGPLLGVQNLGGSIMYSNLRVVGGSNHLLLPTNLLGLSGGLVRIEACTSPTINALYPGDFS